MTFGLSDWINILGQVLDRLPLTLAMLVVSLIFAMLIGIVIAFIRIEKIPVLHQLATVYLSFTRSTPLIVQLFLVYFGIPQLLLTFGIDINHWSRFVFVVITFSLHTGAYLSEVFRSSYLSVGKEQLEAAYSVGMTYPQALRRILIPQAFRVALPNVGNHTIELLKDTALAFTIGIIDIMGQVKLILGNNYGVGMFQIYVAIAVVYWIICILIELVILWIERSQRKKHAGISN
ncbi:amino acid ABC transporter permease [Alteribacillus iranensis]|uniref:Amino acid ABC transporter membrane protein 1, PAAT family n=1 Tax=Alteribacillus iranensis TaxID=930128 RepID=A0A1I2BS86_9BACI|nr:amino acid ABC transporter permease [Alteribacillus iranensis]SFE58193.1 amino acid ABC transporter membrane protein 1, PAAT family [Alteribacillus iranensis]